MLPNGFTGNLSRTLRNFMGHFVSQPVLAPSSVPVAFGRPDESPTPPNALDVIRRSPEYDACRTALAPYGFYKGRFIIGECTRVNGGIFVGLEPHEEIVVDESHGGLLAIYTELMSRLTRLGLHPGSVSEYKIVNEVIKLVGEKLTFNLHPSQCMASFKSIKPRQKVSLDVFIYEKVGAARHQVLLAGYLLEKLKDNGLLQGCIYIDCWSEATAPNAERLIYTSRTGDFAYFEPVATLYDIPAQRAELMNGVN